LLLHFTPQSLSSLFSTTCLPKPFIFSRKQAAANPFLHEVTLLLLLLVVHPLALAQGGETSPQPVVQRTVTVFQAELFRWSTISIKLVLTDVYDIPRISQLAFPSLACNNSIA